MPFDPMNPLSALQMQPPGGPTAPIARPPVSPPGGLQQSASNSDELLEKTKYRMTGDASYIDDLINKDSGTLEKLSAKRDKAIEEQVTALKQEGDYSGLDKVMSGLAGINLGRVPQGYSSLAIGMQGTRDAATKFAEIKGAYKQKALDIQVQAAQKAYDDQWQQEKQMRQLAVQERIKTLSPASQGEFHKVLLTMGINPGDRSPENQKKIMAIYMATHGGDVGKLLATQDLYGADRYSGALKDKNIVARQTAITNMQKQLDDPDMAMAIQQESQRTGVPPDQIKAQRLQAGMEQINSLYPQQQPIADAPGVPATFPGAPAGARVVAAPGTEAQVQAEAAAIEAASLPPGFKPKTNPVLNPVTAEAEKKAAGKRAELETEAAVSAKLDLPKLQDASDLVLTTLNKLEKHPGRGTALGGINILGDFAPANIPGTEAMGFKRLLGQIQGQAFLQAFQSIKGGGAITDIEGKKATDAITRLGTELSDSDFQDAVNDLRDVVQKGLERLRAKAEGKTVVEHAAPATSTPSPTQRRNKFKVIRD